MDTFEFLGVLLYYEACGTLLGSDCMIKKETALDFIYKQYIENYQLTSLGKIMPAEIIVLTFAGLMSLAFGRQPSLVLCFLS